MKTRGIYNLKAASVACALVIGACAPGPESPNAPEQFDMEGREVLAELEGSFDAATGQLTFQPVGGAVATSARGLGELNIVSDGVTGSGPAESIELVTTATRQNLAGCGRADSFCGDVTIRSFYTSRLQNVFAQITQLRPATGFEGFNSDTYPGYSNTMGLWFYGPIGANGGALSRTWYFNQPGGADFRFRVRVLGDIVAGPCTINSCGTRGVCVAGSCVAGRRIFVSATAHDGNLGGAAGADSICQADATALNAPGTWKAWVSTSVSSAASRISHSTDPYYTTAGERLANDWADLTDGTLAANPNRYYAGALAGQAVWTNTNPNGTNYGTGSGCLGFTTNTSSTMQSARVGASNRATSQWTNSAAGYCNVARRLYCVEN